MRHTAPTRRVAALLAAAVTLATYTAAADMGGLPAPAPSARAARAPAAAPFMGRPLATARAPAPAPRPSRTLGWTNMGVLLNVTQPELTVQALAVVGGRPVVGLAGVSGRPEVHARLANGSWERAGRDAVLDESASTLRLASGGAASNALYASLTNTGADVSYPSAQGDSPHGWVRGLLGAPAITNWTYLGKGDASGRGASIARPAQAGRTARAGCRW